MKPKEYLEFLNTQYFKLHKNYEDLFWISYMGDHSVDKRKDKALKERDLFRANPKYLETIKKMLDSSDHTSKKRLKIWLGFFEIYQTPTQVLAIKQKIDALESIIHKKMAVRKEGYIDPYTKKFVSASSGQMRSMMGTNSDEKIRKACFDSREKTSRELLKEYVELVSLRNQYARGLGYSDFYDYKVQREDGMTKDELFSIFNSIYEKTKYAHKNIRNLEKKMEGLRKPWNFGYMMAGDFTKEADPFFQFDEALLRWGRSFAALGINFQKGSLQLDLLDRKGKYNNGFCHWPNLVIFKNNKKLPGSSNFTCNVVFGQLGSGDQGYNTLFHEGGHAAHLLNSVQQDVCINSEYAPMTSSWAETQSMFLDTVFDSIEWRSRYAKDALGNAYPMDLFKRKVAKLNPIAPLGLSGIMFVSNFEKDIYESNKLTAEIVIVLAKKHFKKYFDRSEDSLYVLTVPHIYSWESSASYHGYGLATLALEQWREYFYKKYGYIVDNPNVGKEMTKVWQLAAGKTFKEFVIMATGKKLSSNAYLKDATASVSTIIKDAESKIARLKKIKLQTKPIDLNASIQMVHGKKVIADNHKSFENMADIYKKWVRTNSIKVIKNV